MEGGTTADVSITLIWDYSETLQLSLHWLQVIASTSWPILQQSTPKGFVEALKDVSVLSDRTDTKTTSGFVESSVQCDCDIFALIIYLRFHTQTMLTFACKIETVWIMHLAVWRVYPRERSLFVQCANSIRQHMKAKRIFKWYRFHAAFTCKHVHVYSMKYY